MSEKLIRKKIGEEVYMNSVSESKFKSDRITVNLVVPLKKEKASVNALVPFVLRKGCRSFPDFTKLNKKLAMMYGAILDADVSKQGENQIIEISLQFIDDKYAIDGEKMTEEAAKLLSEIVFDPNLDENGLFYEKDVELEKDYLIDTINSDLNDKRAYAIHKAAQLEFADEPFGISRYGTVEDAEKITSAELVSAWKELIGTSRIEIMFVGQGDVSAIEKVFTERLKFVERKPTKHQKAELIPYKELKTGEESMDIVQGKLVMAFRLGAPKGEYEKNSARVLSAIYGGTAFSKLFLNVREKLSLCYYVTSHFERSTGVLFVDCGIEFANREAAQNEIIAQLENIQNGNVTEDEIAETMLTFRNNLGSIGDSLNAIESWYTTCILDDFIISPEDDAKEVEKITISDVIDMAKRAKLSTVFFLKGEQKA